MLNFLSFSGRGGQCNGTHIRGSGRCNHNGDGSEICPRVEVITPPIYIYVYTYVYRYLYVYIYMHIGGVEGGGGGRVVGREREESDLSRTAIQIHELR